jgi:hypothetical protein
VNEEKRKQLNEQVAAILAMLGDVTQGKYRALDTDLPEHHPMGALIRGVNEAIASLGMAKERTREYLGELE